jgi:two-component system chemotaxis sensor kinase CheA
LQSTEEIENEETFNGSLAYMIVTKASKQEIIHIVNSISDIRTVSLMEITNENIHSFSEGKTVQLTSQKLEQPEKLTMNEEVKVSQTVRVDVSKLEYLMNLVGEIVIDQTRLNGVRSKLLDRYPNDEDVETFQEIANHLSQVVSELQEGIMKTRMLPIEQLFNRFPRMVRDLAQKAGKEIDFVIEGKETELDRNLIEKISDPIIHLLRNSLDHGIESPSERAKKGKPTKGTILLKAAHEENHIVITVSDDGKGIHPEKIKQSAMNKGLIDEEQANKMSDKDLIFLIFKSGISTADKVTDISGRGVGMDIVRSHIEKLNGLIDIDTEVGKGTTFTIKLPLTLAIIPSLMVKMDQKTFALPLANVQEIIRLEPQEIQKVQNHEVGVIRGRMLPIIRLHRLLNGKEEILSRKKRWFVVVIGLAEKRVGLIVDETIGNQEIVIKSLGKYVGSPKYISGATIMGDGKVALILDAGSIVKEEGMSIHQKESKIFTAEHHNTTQIATFLLDSEEYGIGIEAVTDIIHLQPISPTLNAPLCILGMINLRGTLIPVMNIREKLGKEDKGYTRKTRIMIVNDGKNQLGLLVDTVKEVKTIDNSLIEESIKNSLKDEPSLVKGVWHQNGRLISLLDLDQIMDVNKWNQSESLELEA